MNDLNLNSDHVAPTMVLDFEPEVSFPMVYASYKDNIVENGTSKVKNVINKFANQIVSRKVKSVCNGGHVLSNRRSSQQASN